VRSSSEFPGRGGIRGAHRPVLLLLLLALAGIHAPEAHAQETFSSRCGAGVHVEERAGWIWLPEGEVFCPLVADPKQGRTFASYLRGDFATIADPDPGVKTNIAAVGLGDSFAVFRSTGIRSGDGFQVSLAGAVFSQINLDEPSFDLINADYVVGIPATYRSGSFSSRIRAYHQSSHLGDEFLLSREPERTNLSFESLELILSQELGGLRLYAGGESFFRREPEDLPRYLAHGGIELRPVTIAEGRLLAALDLKAVEADDDADWELAWSARAGIEIARIPSPGHPPRVISLTVEFYDGAAPYGQFYREDIRYLGVGLNFAR
jgi:hypothetical protein